MDKVQRIREEVEKLKSQLLRGACSSQVAMETMCKEEAYNEVLAILDTLQEEPVSEELEETAEEWDAKASFTPFYMALDDKGNPHEVKQDYTTHAESFKAGAQWQKEQMMAKAIEMVVGYWMPNGLMLTVDETENCYNIDEGDKVKVIVIKED